mgnify:CR=1 FL=1
MYSIVFDALLLCESPDVLGVHSSSLSRAGRVLFSFCRCSVRMLACSVYIGAVFCGDWARVLLGSGRVLLRLGPCSVEIGACSVDIGAVFC